MTDNKDLYSAIGRLLKSAAASIRAYLKVGGHDIPELKSLGDSLDATGSAIMRRAYTHTLRGAIEDCASFLGVKVDKVKVEDKDGFSSGSFFMGGKKVSIQPINSEFRGTAYEKVVIAQEIVISSSGSDNREYLPMPKKLLPIPLIPKRLPTVHMIKTTPKSFERIVVGNVVCSECDIHYGDHLVFVDETKEGSSNTKVMKAEVVLKGPISFNGVEYVPKKTFLIVLSKSDRWLTNKLDLKNNKNMPV